MNIKQHRTYASGGFVTEDAVRGALSRRRQARAKTTTAARTDRSGPRRHGSTDRESRRANRAAVLRRWSVAELIANGVPRPPIGQTSL